MNNPPETKMSRPESLIENVQHLVSSPEVYLRLKQVLDDPNDTRKQVAGVAACDPSLNTRVSGIANSAYDGFPSRIDRISTAVNITGEKELRNIVLATTLLSTMRSLVVYWSRPGD